MGLSLRVRRLVIIDNGTTLSPRSRDGKPDNMPVAFGLIPSTIRKMQSEDAFTPEPEQTKDYNASRHTDSHNTGPQRPSNDEEPRKRHNETYVRRQQPTEREQMTNRIIIQRLHE